jgi:uncharacterized protein YbaA (DUF1428 family)
MARYVDGFVLVVPKKNREKYRKMAQWGKRVWMKHGAVDYKECVGDELKTNSMGGPTPLTFTKLAKPRAGEEVWFSFIVFKSKKHRNAVNKKVMAEMGKAADKWKDVPMPFDVKRMAYGGFRVVVDK